MAPVIMNLTERQKLTPHPRTSSRAVSPEQRSIFEKAAAKYRLDTQDSEIRSAIADLALAQEMIPDWNGYEDWRESQIREVLHLPKEVMSRRMERAFDPLGPQKPPRLPRPSISLVVATYNRPDMLKETLWSILQQDYPDLEVIVVNDGGTSPSKWIRRNMPAWVRSVNLPKNGGLLAAATKGWSLSHGDIVGRVDDDDWLAENALKRVAAWSVCYPRIGWFYGDGEWRHQWREATTRQFRAPDYDRSALFLGPGIGCTIYYRRRLMARLGGWSGHPSAYDEDWHMPLLASKHAPGMRIPATLYIVRGHTGNRLSHNTDQREEARRWIRERIAGGAYGSPPIPGRAGSG